MVDAAMDAYGRVDVLINNAAQPGTDLHIWEQTLENWNATIAVDVTAAMLCSREVLRRSMIERRRRVDRQHLLDRVAGRASCARATTAWPRPACAR